MFSIQMLLQICGTCYKTEAGNCIYRIKLVDMSVTHKITSRNITYWQSMHLHCSLILVKNLQTSWACCLTAFWGSLWVEACEPECEEGVKWDWEDDWDSEFDSKFKQCNTSCNSSSTSVSNGVSEPWQSWTLVWG